MTYPEESYEPEEILSFQERSTLVELVVSVLVYAIFGFVVWRRYQTGTFDSESVLVFWGRAILVLGGLYILFYIIGQILFYVANTIVTGEEDDELGFEDERDKLFDLISTRNSSAVFGIGFMLSMIALAIGQPATTMFVILLVSMAVSSVVGDVTKLRLYRRGQ